MKRIIPVLIFGLLKTCLIAQNAIPLSLDIIKGSQNVVIKPMDEGRYSINITGAEAYISIQNMPAKYDHETHHYLSFECMVNVPINQVSIDMGKSSNEGHVAASRIMPSKDFTTVVFNLKESLKWTSSIKMLRLKFDKSAGKSILIKNIQLRTPTAAEKQNEPYYLDNGMVRIGVDMTGGGSIFYFAQSKTRRNLLNHADKGRFVQQSYYGVKDGSMWGQKPWNWNPVQGGGSSESGSFPAKVLEKKLEKNAIYIKSRPKHWATGEDIPDATMEEKIELNGKLAHITYTFKYTGSITHPSRSQELPAVFVDYELPNLVFYRGNSPWQNDTLSSVVPGWPNEPQTMTEEWAAYVDDKNWGIGVYVPGTNRMTTYRHKGNLVGGERGEACSYFAPIRKFSISPGLVFTYDVFLTIDDVENMRSAFYKIKKD